MLNLFHTSRQAYAECCPIFFQQNMFDFSIAEPTVTAASMCLALLNDRSQQALQHIRRIHLILGESLYGQVDLSVPNPWPQWGQLCIEVSTVLSLHELILSVNGRLSTYWAHRPPMNLGNFGLQPWVQEVCRITNLGKLEVDVTIDRVYLDRVDLIDHLLARMLANGPRLQKMNGENGGRSVVGCGIELRPTDEVWRFGAARAAPHLGARVFDQQNGRGERSIPTAG